MGHEVEIEAGLRLVEVDGGVQEPVLHLDEQGHQLDQARRGQAVPEHGLGRVDRDAIGVIAEDLLDRLDLGGVGEDRRGAVGVDVVDLLRRDAARRAGRRA